MTEKFKGHIVKWHDEKGFGFIKCQDLSEEIFFHISQYKGKQRPEINEQVAFTLGKNGQGKTQAGFAGARVAVCTQTTAKT